jgi:hypothetical protein
MTLNRELFDRAMDIVDRYSTLPSNPIDNPKPMSEIHHYHLDIDDDTHWGLVKLGAEIKMDYEVYAEEVLRRHVEATLNRKTKD